MGASNAATSKLQELHQVEVHRLQSEIEAQRSKCALLAAEKAAITTQFEDRILQLQNDLDCTLQSEAAAKQSLAHDRFIRSI